MSVHMACLTLAAACLAAAQILPEHAENLTVYHLNPASAGALPVNMDTGDAAGDLYFYLGQFLLPLECQSANSTVDRAHFDCDNVERMDPHGVVTQVDLEVDARSTVYSACNLCNGTDPFSGEPCDAGSYTCDCFSNGGRPCDPTKIGKLNVTEKFAPHVAAARCARALEVLCGSVQGDMDACGACVDAHADELAEATCIEKDSWDFCPSRWRSCNETAPEWACWAENLPRKTAGFWYSTLAAGQCDDESAPGSCGWKVVSMKTVKAGCLASILVSKVESHGPECFESCGPRNMTSACWIGCFFDTVLGVDARHSTSKPLGGMPLAALERGWTDAFLPKEQGGCDDEAIQLRPQPQRAELVV